MSNFTPLVTREYEFEGDTVKVEFARLKRGDVINLMPLIMSMQEEGNQTALPEAVSSMIDLLPKYIHSLKGLKNADGEALNVETLADEVYFMDLASDIAMDIVNESLVMKGEESKND